MNQFQKSQAEKIRACYLDSLEKGGEGSRGGKVIGHTKTGKPIYENPDHPEHKSFTKQEHKNAASLHGAIAKEIQEKEWTEQDHKDYSNLKLDHTKSHIKKWDKHSNAENDHGMSANYLASKERGEAKTKKFHEEKGKVIGKTETGGGIKQGEYQHQKSNNEHHTQRLPHPKGDGWRGPDETGKAAALRVSKEYPDGKHGVVIATGNGDKRYLVHKDSKSGTHEVHPVDEKTYGLATGVGHKKPEASRPNVTVAGLR